MPEKEAEFREIIKNSFLNVKMDIKKLENELKELKELILSKNNEIKDLKDQLKANKEPNIDFKTILDTKKNDSIGNNGVYANMRANMQTSGHILNTSNIKNEIESFFINLTKQEFILFLTIYQLDDEKKAVSYNLLSQYLNLSPGCIRTHITNLLRKKAPIIKTKINNKLTLLGITKEFKDLGLKQKLINLYYHTDPSQTTLI